MPEKIASRLNKVIISSVTEIEPLKGYLGSEVALATLF